MQERRHAAAATAALAVFLATPAIVAQQSIQWTAALDDALAAAKADNRVVMLAFNLPGERASDELIGEHYRDSTLARLSAHTANVLCSAIGVPRVPGVTAAQQQAAEQKARLEVLKVGPGEDVIAPQHVFLGPDGAVLSAVAHRVTKGELEWVWVDAIRKVDQAFAWQLSSGARAPRQLDFGNVARGRNASPPSPEQVHEALKTVRKDRGGLLRNLQLVELLMRSDEPEAVAFVEGTLNGMQPGMLPMALETIGAVSPRVYHGVAANYLGHREDDVRVAAASALERLAEPKALQAIMKRYKVERTERVRGRLLRALATCAPGNKEVAALVDKALNTKDASPDFRAQAVLSLALIEDRSRVQQELGEALRDPSPKVRATVAYAVAGRRDAELALRLGEAAAHEEDAETKAWLAAAAEVVRGGDGKAFASFPERVLGEAPPRAGLQGRGRGGG